MDYNKIILILVVLLVIILACGVFVIFNNNASTNNVNNSLSNNTSSNISVEKVNTEEVSGQSSQSNSNTHLVIAEDGHYYRCDDNGKILEKLGPSKKYYPNDPSAVDYPEAESYYPYKQRQL